MSKIEELILVLDSNTPEKGQAFKLTDDELEAVLEKCLNAREDIKAMHEENKRLREALIKISDYEYNQGLYSEIAQQALGDKRDE